jgi:hypothetical protein
VEGQAEEGEEEEEEDDDEGDDPAEACSAFDLALCHLSAARWNSS